jgi:hypothetical protein
MRAAMRGDAAADTPTRLRTIDAMATADACPEDDEFMLDMLAGLDDQPFGITQPVNDM